jgi:hypothetical protein
MADGWERIPTNGTYHAIALARGERSACDRSDFDRNLVNPGTGFDVLWAPIINIAAPCGKPLPKKKSTEFFRDYLSLLGLHRD